MILFLAALAAAAVTASVALALTCATLVRENQDLRVKLDEARKTKPQLRPAPLPQPAVIAIEGRPRRGPYPLPAASHTRLDPRGYGWYDPEGPPRQ